MSEPNPAALDFLLTRRSRPAKTLTGPVPGREELETLLTAAARSPDHGKLEPWRFIVLTRPALERLAGAVPERGTAAGRGAEDIEKSRRQFADADLAVAVIFAPVDSPKIPQVEQLLSSGCVCLSLLNAALAAGWGANWLTGWPSHDRGFVEGELGLSEHESVTGFIHIGTESFAPSDRPRPDLSEKTTWLEA